MRERLSFSGGGAVEVAGVEGVVEQPRLALVRSPMPARPPCRCSQCQQEEGDVIAQQVGVL